MGSLATGDGVSDPGDGVSELPWLYETRILTLIHEQLPVLSPAVHSRGFDLHGTQVVKFQGAGDLNKFCETSNCKSSDSCLNR